MESKAITAVPNSSDFSIQGFDPSSVEIFGMINIIRDGKVKNVFYMSSSKCLIGRGLHCDIRIQRDSVSNEHAVISIDEKGQAWIQNLSANGLYLNKIFISKLDPLTHQPRDKMKLNHGDSFIISEREFTFELPESKRDLLRQLTSPKLHSKSVSRLVDPLKENSSSLSNSQIFGAAPSTPKKLSINLDVAPSSPRTPSAQLLKAALETLSPLSKKKTPISKPIDTNLQSFQSPPLDSPSKSRKFKMALFQDSIPTNEEYFDHHQHQKEREFLSSPNLNTNFSLTYPKAQNLLSPKKLLLQQNSPKKRNNFVENDVNLISLKSPKSESTLKSSFFESSLMEEPKLSTIETINTPVFDPLIKSNLTNENIISVNEKDSISNDLPINYAILSPFTHDNMKTPRSTSIQSKGDTDLIHFESESNVFNSPNSKNSKNQGHLRQPQPVSENYLVGSSPSKYKSITKEMNEFINKNLTSPIKSPKLTKINTHQSETNKISCSSPTVTQNIFTDSLKSPLMNDSIKSIESPLIPYINELHLLSEKASISYSEGSFDNQIKTGSELNTFSINLETLENPFSLTKSVVEVINEVSLNDEEMNTNACSENQIISNAENEQSIQLATNDQDTEEPKNISFLASTVEAANKTGSSSDSTQSVPSSARRTYTVSNEPISQVSPIKSTGHNFISATKTPSKLHLEMCAPMSTTPSTCTTISVVDEESFLQLDESINHSRIEKDTQSPLKAKTNENDSVYVELSLEILENVQNNKDLGAPMEEIFIDIESKNPLSSDSSELVTGPPKIESPSVTIVKESPLRSESTYQLDTNVATNDVPTNLEIIPTKDHESLTEPKFTFQEDSHETSQLENSSQPTALSTMYDSTEIEQPITPLRRSNRIKIIKDQSPFSSSSVSTTESPRSPRKSTARILSLDSSQTDLLNDNGATSVNNDQELYIPHDLNQDQENDSMTTKQVINDPSEYSSITNAATTDLQTPKRFSRARSRASSVVQSDVEKSSNIDNKSSFTKSPRDSSTTTDLIESNPEYTNIEDSQNSQANEVQETSHANIIDTGDHLNLTPNRSENLLDKGDYTNLKQPSHRKSRKNSITFNLSGDENSETSPNKRTTRKSSRERAISLSKDISTGELADTESIPFHHRKVKDSDKSPIKVPPKDFTAKSEPSKTPKTSLRKSTKRLLDDFDSEIEFQKDIKSDTETRSKSKKRTYKSLSNQNIGVSDIEKPTNQLSQSQEEDTGKRSKKKKVNTDSEMHHKEAEGRTGSRKKQNVPLLEKLESTGIASSPLRRSTRAASHQISYK